MYPTIEQSRDEELHRRIISFLIGRGVQCIDGLQLTVGGGVVTVDGRLTSDNDQRLCLECCRHMAGVVRVVDRTRVARVRARRRQATFDTSSNRDMRVAVST